MSILLLFISLKLFFNSFNKWLTKYPSTSHVKQLSMW